MRFKEKVVLITGASRGIGKATALLFAKEGAKVVVNYCVSDYEPDAEKNAKEVVLEIKKFGSEALAFECDVSSEKHVESMFETAIKKFGRIDVLVNNAGIVFDVPFMEKTSEQSRRTIDINLFGTIYCSKYAVKQMLKQKSGNIVNISSTNAMNSFNPDSMDYDASKAGIAILTKDLAKEFAPSIRVNALAPGWIDTPMNKDLPKSMVKEETEKIYLKRFGKPEEIGKVILFLASEDASFINGSVLVVDGGYN